MKYSATVYSLFCWSTQHGVAWLSGDWLLGAREKVKQTEAAHTVCTKRKKCFWISQGILCRIFQCMRQWNWDTSTQYGATVKGFKKFNYLCGVNKRNKATIKVNILGSYHMFLIASYCELIFDGFEWLPFACQNYTNTHCFLWNPRIGRV